MSSMKQNDFEKYIRDGLKKSYEEDNITVSEDLFNRTLASIQNLAETQKEDTAPANDTTVRTTTLSISDERMARSRKLRKIITSASCAVAACIAIAVGIHLVRLSPDVRMADMAEAPMEAAPMEEAPAAEAVMEESEYDANDGATVTEEKQYVKSETPCAMPEETDTVAMAESAADEQADVPAEEYELESDSTDIEEAGAFETKFAVDGIGGDWSVYEYAGSLIGAGYGYDMIVLDKTFEMEKKPAENFEAQVGELAIAESLVPAEDAYRNYCDALATGEYQDNPEDSIKAVAVVEEDGSGKMYLGFGTTLIVSSYNIGYEETTTVVYDTELNAFAMLVQGL